MITIEDVEKVMLDNVGQFEERENGTTGKQTGKFTKEGYIAQFGARSWNAGFEQVWKQMFLNQWINQHLANWYKANPNALVEVSSAETDKTLS